MSGRPRLVLFPGLGMDGRTLEPQRRGLAGAAEVVVPPWVRPMGSEESLRDYARRMAGEAGRWGDGEMGEERPLYLGGVSIGGAIALEVARHVRAEGVFLIASATTSRAIPNLLRSLGQVAPVIPTFAYRPFVRLAGPVVRLLMRGYPEAREILSSAIRDLDLELWKWGARAIMRWEFEGEMPCPVHQIHGDADVITPVYRVSPDVIVRGGGHMLNVTHPGDVDAFVAGRLGGDRGHQGHEG